MWLCDGKVFSAGLPQYGQLGHNTDHEYNAKDCKLRSGPALLYVHGPLCCYDADLSNIMMSTLCGA